MGRESGHWAPEIPAGATKMVISYSAKTWASLVDKSGGDSKLIADLDAKLYREMTEEDGVQVEPREVDGGMEFVLTFKTPEDLQQETVVDSTLENAVFEMGGQY